MGIDSLILIQQPQSTALIFVNGFLCPWEAYLARYPDMPLVLIVGNDDDERKGHCPRPSQLAGHVGYRLLRRMHIDCHNSPCLMLAVYERACGAA